MRRVVASLVAVSLLCLAACETEPTPPSEVEYFRAQLHGKGKCDAAGTVRYRFAWHEQSQPSAWVPGPWHEVNCPGPTGEVSLPHDGPEWATGLKDDTTYEIRIESDTGGMHHYDSVGTANGTNYDTFHTKTYPTVAADPASWIRASIGMNTRLAYGGTPHANCAKVRESLAYMGIKYVRDGLWPSDDAQWTCFRALQGDGVKGTLFFLHYDHAYENPGWVGSRLDQVVADGTVTNFVDKFESINEPGAVKGCADSVDNDQDGTWDTTAPSADAGCASATDESESLTGVQTTPTWATRIRGFQQRLWDGVHARPSLASKKVLGPALIGGYSEVGDISQWLDNGAYHPYPAGEKPGDNFAGYNQNTVCAIAAGSKKCQATEVGYHTDLGVGAVHYPVSEAVRVTYTLRLVLEAYWRGIPRTDLYTIVSQWCNSRADGVPTTADFGFYDCDWTPFPVVHAMHNFTTVAGNGGAGNPLKMSVDSQPSDLRRLVWQRGDGAYVVALWRDVSVWNTVNKTPISVSPADVTLTFARAASVHSVRPDQGTTETAVPISGNRQVTVPVAGDTVLLVIR
jgi:hypothetical protein